MPHPNPLIGNFDSLSNSQLLTLETCAVIAQRSRVSLYRDHRAGKLPFVKLGVSTRVKVGDLRKLIGAA